MSRKGGAMDSDG